MELSPPTVRDVLDFDALSGARVLAGEESLDREVTGANIIEVPDVHKWLRGGEILFTAGYAWRDRPNGLVDTLADLDSVGIAAIGIKPGKYLREIPQRLVDVANDLKLPLIRIPKSVAYRDVIDPLYKRLSTQRLWLLERSAQAHEKLISLGLDYQSVEKVALALSLEVNNPVYVVDLINDAAFIARADGKVVRTPIKELPEEDLDLITNTAKLNLHRVTKRVQLEDMSALGASLIVGRRVRGRVVVPEIAGSLDGLAELAITHAAELISFLFMRQIAIIEGRLEAGKIFLESLLSDSLTNEEATERALTLGIRLTVPCAAMIIGLSDAPNVGRDDLSVLAERALGPLPHVLGIGEGGNHVLAVVQAPESIEDTLKGIAERLQSARPKKGLARPIVGVGSPLTGVDGVRRSRSQALIAYHAARRRLRSGIVRFSDLGVERILAQIPIGSLTSDYIDMKLGPLLADPELLRTLESYLEHGSNKVATAAAFPLHRSSLVYRLEKIARLIDADLDNPEERLELWLLLRLRRMMQLSPSASSH